MFCFGDPLTILAYRNLHGANFACATCNQLLQALVGALRQCFYKHCRTKLSSLRSVGMTGSRFDLAYIELTLNKNRLFFSVKIANTKP